MHAFGPNELLHAHVGILSLERWINDGLMAVFFLLVGLELERELYVGELSEPKKPQIPGSSRRRNLPYWSRR